MLRRAVSMLIAVCLMLALPPLTYASNSKLAALTFDDGPGIYSERLLDGLLNRGVRATFFCQGASAMKYPDLIRRIVTEGHQLANHTFDHPNLNALPVSEALDQVHRTDAILNEITGGRESYFVRPPYGNTTQAFRTALKAPVVIWSVDTIDWQLLNAEAVKNKLLNDIFDGAIVLMHDIHRTSVDAILMALDELFERGYELVTVKELCRRRGVLPQPGTLLYDCRPKGITSSSLLPPKLKASKNDDLVTIELTTEAGVPIFYTLDGSPVSYGSTVYSEPLTIRIPCTIRAVSAWDLNGGRSDEVVAEYALPLAAEPHISVRDGSIVCIPDAIVETVYVSYGSMDVYQ